jgi:hypothetical protein
MKEQFLAIKKDTIKCMITFVEWVSKTTRNENMIIVCLKEILKNYKKFMAYKTTFFYDFYFLNHLKKKNIKILSVRKKECIINFLDKLKNFLQYYTLENFYNILSDLYSKQLNSQLYPKHVSFGDIPPDQPKTKIKKSKSSTVDKTLFYSSSDKKRMKNQSHNFKGNIKEKFEDLIETIYSKKEVKRIMKNLDKKVEWLVKAQEKKIDHLKTRQATKYFLEIIIMEETELLNQGYQTNLLSY